MLDAHSPSSLVDLAASYESSASTTAAAPSSSSGALSSSPSSSLPDPVTVYRTGLALLHRRRLQRRQRQQRSGNDSFDNNDDDEDETLSSSFDSVLRSMPRSYLRDVVLTDINRAFVTLIDTSFSHTASKKGGYDNDDGGGGGGEGDVAEATGVLREIYSRSNTACRVGFDVEVGAALARAYDRAALATFPGGGGGGRANAAGGRMEENWNEAIQSCARSALSSLLLHGLVPSLRSEDIDGPDSGNGGGGDEDGDDDGLLRSTMERMQSLLSAISSSGGESGAIGDVLQWQREHRGIGSGGTNTLIDVLRSKFPNGAEQLDYLLLMIESCPTSSSLLKAAASKKKSASAEEEKSANSKKLPSKQRSAKATVSDALQRRINQIRDVLPHLGEGYVETALAIHRHDVDTTLSALIEGDSDPTVLHPRLRALDKSLPRRKRDGRDDRYGVDGSGADDEDAAASKETQRALLQRMEREEEEAAYLLDRMALVGGAAFDDDGGLAQAATTRDEYDDDYDDQYDGIGDDGGAAGEVGGADVGMFDVDVDAIRAYNRLRKEAEAEGSFWEENRNLNRGRGRGRKPKATAAAKDVDDDGGDGSNGDAAQRKYRGPDKGKGGRIMGPDGKYIPTTRGGKKGRGKRQQAAGEEAGPADENSSGRNGGSNPLGKKGPKGSSSGGTKPQENSDAKSGEKGTMTKIQKRRKNDNKAKIANHHRKERATRKARGMV